MDGGDIYTLYQSGEFNIKPGEEVSVNLKLKRAPPLPCTKLYGKVLSGCGKISGATVKILDENFNPVYHTETGDDGKFAFINTLIPGNYQVMATADSYEVSECSFISLTPFKPLYITIKLKPDQNADKAAVYGVVRNGENIPLSNARVFINGDDKKDSSTDVTITNVNGEYLFSGLTPGRYVLSAFLHGYVLSGNIKLEVFPKDIFCADIYLYKTQSALKGTVTGKVIYDGVPVPHALTALYRKEYDKYSLIKLQKANSEGAYLFSDLKSGEYFVTARPEN